MLTVHEVAEKLRCAVSTVYSLIQGGRLCALRIGPRRGGLRITEEDLQAFLNSSRVTPQPALPSTKTVKLKHLR